MNTRLWLAIGISAFGAVTFAHAYRGEGQFVDRGRFEAHNRYVLDLGPIDLTKSAKRTFEIGELPREEFAVGLDISSLDGSAIQAASLAAKICLRLENERNQIVFDICAPPKDWILSKRVGEETKGFLYLRGVETQVPVREGIVRLEKGRVGPDGGWGTYFTPRSGALYRLVLESEVSVPPPHGYSARLTAIGGGWK